MMTCYGGCEGVPLRDLGLESLKAICVACMGFDGGSRNCNEKTAALFFGASCVSPVTALSQDPSGPKPNFVESLAGRS